MSKPRKSSSASRSFRPTTMTQRWRSPVRVRPATRSRSARWPATHERTRFGAIERKGTKYDQEGQEHHQAAREEGRIHGRGTYRDEGACQRVESGRASARGRGGRESAVLATIT